MIFQVLEILKVVLRITIKQVIKICLIIILKSVFIIFNTWKIKIFKYLKKKLKALFKITVKRFLNDFF